MKSLKNIIKIYLKTILGVSKQVRIVAYSRHSDNHENFYIEDIIECGSFLRKDGNLRTHFNEIIDKYLRECNRIVIETPGSETNKLQLDF